MKPLLAIAIAIAIAIAAPGCKREVKPDSATIVAPGQPLPHLLRTYKTPPGHERAVERLLRGNSYPISVVSANGVQTRFVKLNPQFTRDGHFVLSAPEEIHRGVEDVLAMVAKSEPAPPAPSIEVTYWMVQASPEAGPADPALAALASPLAAATEELGPHRFELLERIQVVALDGEQGSSRGRYGTVRHTASAVGERVELRLDIEFAGGERPAEIETAVSLRFDSFAVIGQAGFGPLRSKGGADQATAALLFIARARAR